MTYTDYDLGHKDLFITRLRAMSTANNPILLTGEVPKITKRDVVMYAKLMPGQSTYNFSMRDNGALVHPGEKRLKETEYFLPLYAAIGIQKHDTDPAAVKTFNNFPVFHYPDPNYFTGDDQAGALEACALQTVYQGDLSFKSESETVMQGICTRHMEFRPTTPYLVGGANGEGADQLPAFGCECCERGYYRLDNDSVYIGNQTNEVCLNLGPGNKALIEGGVDAGGDANTTCNYVVIFLKGYVFHGKAGASAICNLQCPV